MKVVDLARIKASCESCNLSELCLPRGLSGAELEQVSRVVRRSRPLHKGEVLFRAGDPLTALHAVRSGCIKLLAVGADLREQIVGFYLPGEILGLDGMEHRRHSCTAVALETSSTCTLPYADLTATCKQIPALQEQMLRIMGREISMENELLLTVNHRNAAGRIATLLFSLSSRFHRLGYSASQFNLGMSRRDIGAYLGLTIETVSRVFSRLKKQGVITVNHRHVVIRDMPRLKELAGMPAGAEPIGCGQSTGRGGATRP